jgi:hypothetical protein
MEDEIDSGCSTRGGVERYAYKILIGRSYGKSSHVSLKCRWLGDVKTEAPEIIWKVVNWIIVSQDGEQWGSIECSEFCE